MATRRSCTVAPWAVENSSIASRSPAITVLSGPLRIAGHSRFVQGSSSSCTRAAGSETASIPPVPVSRSNARLRSATIRAASSSEIAPATQAAVISPCECPSTAAGSTPSDRQSAASATITANSTGWITSEPSSAGASSSPRSTSSTDQSMCAASAPSQRQIQSQNTSLRSSSSTAIPAHWVPWPGKTNTGSTSVAVPVTAAGCDVPPASAASAASSSVRSAATTTARWANTARRARLAPTATSSACEAEPARSSNRRA